MSIREACSEKSLIERLRLPTILAAIMQIPVILSRSQTRLARWVSWCAAVRTYLSSVRTTSLLRFRTPFWRAMNSLSPPLLLLLLQLSCF